MCRPVKVCCALAPAFRRQRTPANVQSAYPALATADAALVVTLQALAKSVLAQYTIESRSKSSAWTLVTDHLDNLSASTAPTVADHLVALLGSPEDELAVLSMKQPAERVKLALSILRQAGSMHEAMDRINHRLRSGLSAPPPPASREVATTAVSSFGMAEDSKNADDDGLSELEHKITPANLPPAVLTQCQVGSPSA